MKRFIGKMIVIKKYILLLVMFVVSGAIGSYILFQKELAEAPSVQEGVVSSSPSPETQGTVKREKNRVVVNLSNRGLTEFPKEILSNTGITTLILSNNNIKTLPSEIGRLTNLRELYLDNNQLEGALVGEVRHMSKLEILDAHNNNMTGIPAEIGQLKHLVTLNLADNMIDTMPDEIRNISENLKTLDLSNNTYSQETLLRIEAMLQSTNVIY